MIDRATKSVRSGDIVLFHNDSQYILEALPAILKSYQAQGYTVVPVSQLLLPGETTIDVQGRQHAAAANARLISPERRKRRRNRPFCRPHG